MSVLPVMDNPQPAGQLPVALPLRGPMGAPVRLGVRGGAQLALHHLHLVSHGVLEEEPPTVRVHAGVEWNVTEESMFPSRLDAGAKAPRWSTAELLAALKHSLSALPAGLWRTASTCVTGW